MMIGRARWWWVLGWMCAVVVVCCAHAVRADDPTAVRVPKGPIVAESTVGIEGTVLYRYEGPELRARPANDKSPVVVRIVTAVPDGSATLYDLRFIANREGVFDLRKALRRIDNESLSAAPTAVVKVSALLSAEHNGELAQISETGVPALGGYVWSLIALGAAWVLVPLLLVARRLLRRAPPAAVPPPPPPTFADQLRPLVEGALSATATVADRARLEMLLIAYWRERLGLAALPHRAAVAALREHEQAGAILIAVEMCLHRPARSGEPLPDVAALLAPYRGAPALAGVGQAALSPGSAAA